jgi:filamentous hemagglutinin
MEISPSLLSAQPRPLFSFSFLPPPPFPPVWPTLPWTSRRAAQPSPPLSRGPAGSASPPRPNHGLRPHARRAQHGLLQPPPVSPPQNCLPLSPLPPVHVLSPPPRVARLSPPPRPSLGTADRLRRPPPPCGEPGPPLSPCSPLFFLGPDGHGACSVRHGQPPPSPSRSP